MSDDDLRDRVQEIKMRKLAGRRATVWYSNHYEERGKVKGRANVTEYGGVDMLSVTQNGGTETFLRMSDVERIDFGADGPTDSD